MESCIYAFVCLPTDQVYIGYAVIERKRKKEHLDKLARGTHKNEAFQVAWNEFGSDNFEFKVLEYCDIDKLVEREEWWIRHYRSYLPQFGFNQKIAGSYCSLTHGMSGTPTWKSWDSMIQRCTNENSPDYPRYGGAGITICERWMKFENFYADMGKRPEGMTLDRFPDKKGNYEPGNCRWATPAEQQRNLKSNTYVAYKGETKLLIDWAEEKGIPRDLLRQRLNRGMKDDELFAPSYSRFKGIEGAQRRKRASWAVKYAAHGKTLTIKEWSKELGVTVNTLEQRLQKYRMPPEKALVSGNLPKGAEGPRKGHRMITAFGKTQSLTSWARERHMSPYTLKNRLDRANMKPEDALQ